MANSIQGETSHIERFSLNDCSIDESMHEGGGSMCVMFNNVQIAHTSIHLHKRHVKINKFGVEKEYRGLGVGKMLMLHILEWCEANKIFTATVNALSGITENMVKIGITKGLTQAQLEDFYRSFGFVDQREGWLLKDFGRKSFRSHQTCF